MREASSHHILFIITERRYLYCTFVRTGCGRNNFPIREANNIETTYNGKFVFLLYKNTQIMPFKNAQYISIICVLTISIFNGRLHYWGTGWADLCSLFFNDFPKWLGSRFIDQSLILFIKTNELVTKSNTRVINNSIRVFNLGIVFNEFPKWPSLLIAGPVLHFCS